MEYLLTPDGRRYVVDEKGNKHFVDNNGNVIRVELAEPTPTINDTILNIEIANTPPNNSTEFNGKVADSLPSINDSQKRSDLIYTLEDTEVASNDKTQSESLLEPSKAITEGAVEQWVCLSDIKPIHTADDAQDIDLFLPGGKQKEMIETRSRLPEKPEDAETHQEGLYTDILERSFFNRSYNDLMFNKVEGEKGKDWTQGVKSEQGLLTALRSKVAVSQTKVTGVAAVNRIRTLLGKGAPITIPLWHSGFYATFNSPDEDAILALHNRITSERVLLGRKVFGAALANDSVYTNKAVLDFAVDHLVDTNLVEGKDGFLENLSALDIQHVAWGLACAMYQNGFDFARAVITDSPDLVMQRGKVNVSKLQWTHTPSLTDKQLRHMHYTRTKRISKEALEVYKSEFTKGQPREVSLSDKLKVTLTVPSAELHLTAGFSWIEGLVRLIESSFTVEGGDRERNLLIQRQSKATQLRQFDHWVSKISVRVAGTDDWEVFERDEDQTVELILADQTDNDEVRRNFFNAVRDYLQDSTVSIIAVTAASPAEREEALPRFAELFPIDAVAVFTLLSARRAHLVADRESF